MDSFYFYCDSDLHFSADDDDDITPMSYKNNNATKVIEAKPDLVLVAGDMTNNGSDGSKFMCIPISGPEKQLQGYLTQYVEPITANGIQVYSCLGNHDNWTYPPYVYKAIVKYIKKKHGGIYYNFIHKGVQFICLNIYPDSAGLKYFKKVADATLPIVLFFHYNLEGEMSGWWTDEEKEAFKNTISGYSIKLIVTGHLHEAHEGIWNGYSYIICGGAGIYKCFFSAETQSVSVSQVV